MPPEIVTTGGTAAEVVDVAADVVDVAADVVVVAAFHTYVAVAKAPLRLRAGHVIVAIRSGPFRGAA